jgi:6-phosphofructokinase 1
VSSTTDPNDQLDFSVQSLGPRKVESPYRAFKFVSDAVWTPFNTKVMSRDPSEERVVGAKMLGFELAGPREKIYFDPIKTRCGIVTCGGLCPGLNDVIRAITLQLYHRYGVRNIYGFRYGFEGLIPRFGHDTVHLNLKSVSGIHQHGGTVLGSSRGPQDPEEMVDALERLNIQVLFCIGGDGTFRAAMALCDEIKRRALKIAVVGVPKTIDNDIAFTSRTFGFQTAYSIAADAIRSAHVEATGAPNGIGLLKLMGRHAGFIAAHAALARRDANFVLVPEVEFELGGVNGFLPHLIRRLRDRHHAVVVVAEGAGRSLFENDPNHSQGTDPSGNVRMEDIGTLLRDRISQYLKLMSIPFNLKYIDPSYLIRSAPATPQDSLFAGTLGQMAAHAAMAGKTGMFVGYWNDHFTHVPIAAAVANTRRLDPGGNFWQSVVECTGQPAQMVNRGEEYDAAECELLAGAHA